MLQQSNALVAMRFVQRHPSLPQQVMALMGGLECIELEPLRGLNPLLRDPLLRMCTTLERANGILGLRRSGGQMRWALEQADWALFGAVVSAHWLSHFQALDRRLLQDDDASTGRDAPAQRRSRDPSLTPSSVNVVADALAQMYGSMPGDPTRDWALPGERGPGEGSMNDADMAALLERLWTR